MITVDREVCTGCGGCIDLCPAIALSMVDDRIRVDSDICTECKICVKVCPVDAPHQESAA